MNNILPKIITIVGPNASGKSSLAVKMAKKFNGEIVSADSRQVYKGLNIGSGKVTKKEMGGIPHHLLDVVSPKKTFSVAQYKKIADLAIKKILKKEKLPIICGGAGFYIKTLIDNIDIPEVKPNLKLRKHFEKKTPIELSKYLIKLDPKRATEIDLKNPRRIIRAIEIANELGKTPEIKSEPKYNILEIGIKTDNNKLKKKILKRINKRLKNGMMKEIIKLQKKGLSYKRMFELGLEYRYLSLFLQKKISKKEMLDKLFSETYKYAKRQITWFKKDERVKWCKISDKKKIEKKISNFLQP